MNPSSFTTTGSTPHRCRRPPPRRGKSSDTQTSGSLLYDDVIREDREFRPRAPPRGKSSEELEAELLGYHEHEHDDDDIPHQIDLSQLASHLQDHLRLEQDGIDDDDDRMRDEDDTDDPAAASASGPHKRRVPSALSSFSSTGSSLTRMQRREPGRFVTPTSSFHDQRGHGGPLLDERNRLVTCPGVDRMERVTVDPRRLITADASFRLPLVGSLTDDRLVVPKTKKTKVSDDDDDHDYNNKPTPPQGRPEPASASAPLGRKTIQLEGVFPTISLDDGDDASSARPPELPVRREAQEEEGQPPPPSPRMFGLKRESRRSLLRPPSTTDS